MRLATSVSLLSLAPACALKSRAGMSKGKAAEAQINPVPPDTDPTATDKSNTQKGGQSVRISSLPTASASASKGKAKGNFDLDFPDEFRTISGMNSGGEESFGDHGLGLRRGPEGALYADGVFEIETRTESGGERPNARVVSNALNQEELIPSSLGLSDWFWQWGQWLDHDYSEVPTDGDSISVDLPEGDPFGVQNPLPVVRSHLAEEHEGIAVTQLNEITGPVDAGNVYSHSETRLGLTGLNHTLLADNALKLDGFEKLGTGLLRTQRNALGHEMLPNNTAGFHNGIEGDILNYLAGDIRVNEQLGLAVVHTLWMREHNFWASLIRQSSDELTGREIFEMARVIVQAEIQKITYEDWFPLLIGDAIPEYDEYDPSVNPNVLTIGAGCAFRVGHTFISDTLQRIFDDGTSDPIALADGFDSPQLVDDIGLNPYMRGFASQVCQESDPFLVDGLRNRLLPNPAGVGQDLMVRNIQRARDWGIPTLNTIREAFGLPAHRSFNDFEPEFGALLATVYESPDDVDCFPGMLSEVHVEGSQLGDSMTTVIARQFQDIRDGDRFFYKNILDGDLLDLIEGTTLSQVMERNADSEGSLALQENAFLAAPAQVTKKMIRGKSVSKVA